MKKKKQFVHPSRKGQFTAKAKKHGMGVQEFAKHVLANSDQYDTTTVRQANFAKNATKFKHQAGGRNMPVFMPGNTFATNAQEDAFRTNMLPSAEGWASTPQGRKVMDYYKQKGFVPSFNNDRVTFSRGTGIYDESPYVKDANILAETATGISNLIQNSRLKRREQLNVLDSIQPHYNQNPDQYGLNDIPMYSQYGGSINGGIDYMGPDNSMHDWMYEGLAHPDFYAHKMSMYQYGGVNEYNDKGAAMRKYKVFPEMHPNMVEPMQRNIQPLNLPQQRNSGNFYPTMDSKENYLGVGYSIPKTPAYIEAGASAYPGDNGQQQIYPSVSGSYSTGAGEIGAEWSPGSVGLTFSKQFQYGGDQYFETGGDGMDYEPDYDSDEMVPEFPYGGGPLTAKGAKEILKDGTVHGHPLTAKQKRYFGWIAGGRKQAGGCDDCDNDYDSMMDDNDYDMMKAGGKWIQKAIKHPGRCSNPGDSRCPKGSPQYRLAMRFKHGDLHKKKQTGGAIYDVGQYVDISPEKMEELREKGYDFEPAEEKKKTSTKQKTTKTKKSKNKFSIL